MTADAPIADDPPFVPVAEVPVLIGRSGEATLRLLHPSISRRHATVSRARGGLSLVDHDSRFGTFVNGARVRTAPLRTGDTVQFGSAVTYRVEPDGLRLDAAAEGLELASDGLAISVPRDRDLRELRDELRDAGAVRAWKGLLRPGHKSLIKDIGLRARPDAFVGILGPSGAGKSTLLNCLASYLPPGRGRVVFDGRRDAYSEPDAYRTMLGHVPQDDVVFRALTVRENLAFAARLRLGREAGDAAIATAIGQALDRVGLTEEHADKAVAVLSGGQRKRLSVAIELLRRPRLLLLDEPTSGLDPFSEAHLMEQLRLVARQGTTVICTTHLMDSIGLLDEVVALGVVEGVGRLAYAGPPGGLLPHFRCRGYADLYEVLAAGRFEPVVPPVVASPETAEAPRAPEDARVLPGLGLVEPRPDTGTTPTSRRPGIGQLAASLAADSGWGQLLVVAQRALRLVTRDRGLVLAMLAQPLVLGLLVALTQYNVARNNIFPILFFAVIIAIWLGLNNAARDLVRERRHYVRDHLAGLSPAAYLGAKTLVHAVIGLAQVLVLLTVLRVGCGLVVDPGVREAIRETLWIGVGSVLMLSYLGGVGLGLLASTLARTEEAAVAALPLLILPQLLLSAVATGTQGEAYTKARPFRPLIVTLTSHQTPPSPAVLVDLLSMACLSRPATLVVDARAVEVFGRWTWLGDLCHLLILLLGTWLSVFLAFQWSERRWLRLIGL
jgi:ABC-type multidrug transport system ATPase subunit